MRKVLAILLISIFSLGATVRADEGNVVVVAYR